MRQGRTTCLGGTMWLAQGAEGSLGCNIGTAELWSSFGSVAGRKRVWLILLPRQPMGEENVAAVFVAPMLPIYPAACAHGSGSECSKARGCHGKCLHLQWSWVQ